MKEYYALEKMGIRFSIVPPFFCKDWVKVEHAVICFGGVSYQEKHFDSVENAKKYIEGLSRKPFQKEVVEEINED